MVVAWSEVVAVEVDDSGHILEVAARGTEESRVMPGGWGGREVQEGGDMCIHMADSLRCTTEANTAL